MAPWVELRRRAQDSDRSDRNSPGELFFFPSPTARPPHPERLTSSAAASATSRPTLTAAPCRSHWTNLFGVVTLACIVVLIVTGLLLMFFYTPSSDPTTYTGGYTPLHGADVSQAFASTMRITFDVPGGLLIRQAHHWARCSCPRRSSCSCSPRSSRAPSGDRAAGLWVLLFLIFIVASPAGGAATPCPTTCCRAPGLRITEGIALGIPVVGTWLVVTALRRAVPGPDHRAPVSAARGRRARRSSSRSSRCARSPPGGTSRRSSRAPGAPSATSWASRCSGRSRPRRRLFAIVTGLLVLDLRHRHREPDLALRPGLARATPAPAASPTGTPASSTARSGSCRPGWEFVWLDRTWTLAILVPLAVVTVYLLARRRLPLRRGVDHGRPPRAPPARPPAQRADPHRDRRRRHRLLRHPLARRQRRPHRRRTSA